LSELEEVELGNVEAYVDLYWIGSNDIDTWLSTCFSDLKV